MKSWLFSFEKATNSSSFVKKKIKLNYNTIQLTNLVQEVSVCIFLDLGFNFHLEFRQGKFRSLQWFVCVNKLNLLFCLNKIFVYYHYVSSQKSDFKKKKNSFGSRGRATSAYIGREFLPLCLLWWALGNGDRNNFLGKSV